MLTWYPASWRSQTTRPSGKVRYSSFQYAPITHSFYQSLCYTVRTDGKLLTPETLETVLEFLLQVIEDMSHVEGADGWGPLHEYLTPRAFEMFSRTYFRLQREKGRVGFDGPYAPL